MRHPELSHSQIARRVGCSPSNVTCVLKTFLGKNSDAQLADFQDNKADIYDAIQHRVLASITDKKLGKTGVRDAVVAAGILEDKARLVRGQATGINVTVLMDVVEAIRSRQSSTSSQPTINARVIRE